MRGCEKKLSSREPERTPCPNTDTDDPTLIASLKLKKGLKVCHSKKHKPKLKSHLKSPGLSAMSKKKDLARRKLMGNKTASKRKRDPKPSKKPSLSNIEGVGVKLIGCEANGDVNAGEANNRRKKKKKSKKKISSELDEPARLQRRTRYLLIKMNLEQNLIDAYSAEGWKGQSREKIRPEKELQRAKKQILKCKLSIRDIVRQLDMLSSAGSIEDSLMAPDGSIHHEHIFCAKCKSSEAFPDNDIILCDGTCNSAFHQKCLDPPLDTESIPPGDQGWFCRYCDCRIDILEALNAHLGTHFSMNNSWEDVFKEEASFPEDGNALLNPDDEWPSDDSEDIDYNPKRRENSGSIGVADTDDNASEDECSYYSSGGSDESSDGEILCGRRQRRHVDYIKLYDEMFGKDAPPHEQISEDEDWGPTKRRKKAKESDAAHTLMALHETEKNGSDDENGHDKTELSLDTQIRRSFFRIPRFAVERLREVFAENELPSRDVKENVSKELGLDPEKVKNFLSCDNLQVSKWFKNARYLALKTRKAEKENEVQTCKGNDVILSENTQTETVVDITGNNVKKSDQRKRTKSMNMTSLRSPSTNRRSIKESVELGGDDDVTLKKLLNERNREKKRVKFKDAEAEMERLYKVKGRLENLKQRLLRFQNGKAKPNSNKKPLNEKRSVIYVPVAELHEKA